MKEKTKLGLAGILLGATLSLTKPGFSQESPKRNYIPETIYGVEYSDNQANKAKYKLESQRFFKNNGEGYFLKQNKDLDEGELNFKLIPKKEGLVWESLNFNKSELKGKEYIPTRLYRNEKQVNMFEIKDKRINKKIKKRLKKHKIKSENSFGYSRDIQDDDFKKILPQSNIRNQEYLYFDINKVNFFQEINKSLEKIPLNINDSRDEFFVPLNQRKVMCAINPNTKNIMIYSSEGIFIPTLEENQTDIPIKEEKTDYMFYKEKLEKERTSNKKTSENYYIVKPGDTFWNLSEKFYGTGKDASKLMKKNNCKNAKELKVGDKIIY